MHNREKHLKCEVCGKKFYDHHRLDKHAEVHAGIRNYKCTWPGCELSFNLKASRKTHLRRHTGEKACKCIICGEGFINGAGL